MNSTQNIDIETITKETNADHPLLIDRIAKALSIDRNEALDVFKELLRFLALVSCSKNRLTPSLKIDLAWHEFILFTRPYTNTCELLFGRYIHHSPGGDEKENQDQFKQTIQSYETNYGPLPHDLWGIDNGSEKAPCGPCSS